MKFAMLCDYCGEYYSVAWDAVIIDPTCGRCRRLARQRKRRENDPSEEAWP